MGNQAGAAKMLVARTSSTAYENMHIKSGVKALVILIADQSKTGKQFERTGAVGGCAQMKRRERRGAQTGNRVAMTVFPALGLQPFRNSVSRCPQAGSGFGKSRL